jgi:hypothetical protein
MNHTRLEHETFRGAFNQIQLIAREVDPERRLTLKFQIPFDFMA